MIVFYLTLLIIWVFIVFKLTFLCFLFLLYINCKFFVVSDCQWYLKSITNQIQLLWLQEFCFRLCLLSQYVRSSTTKPPRYQRRICHHQGNALESMMNRISKIIPPHTKLPTISEFSPCIFALCTLYIHKQFV